LKSASIVVEYVRLAVPVHVVRAEELVEAVAQLVSVAIPDLGPVAREAEDDDVACLGIADRQLEPVHDPRLCRALIDEHVDVLVRHAERGFQKTSDERDVVHTPGQRGTSGRS
jgi:hypothetical protein